jgi:hypothetical protein
MNLGRAYESKRDWMRAKEEYRLALSEKNDYTPAGAGIGANSRISQLIR